jgi:hypothetical protein
MILLHLLLTVGNAFLKHYFMLLQPATIIFFLATSVLANVIIIRLIIFFIFFLHWMLHLFIFSGAQFWFQVAKFLVVGWFLDYGI